MGRIVMVERMRTADDGKTAGAANQNSAPLPDPQRLSEAMLQIAGRSQKLVQEFLARQAETKAAPALDPMNIGQAFIEMTQRLMADPAKLVQAQMALWQDYATLWTRMTQRLMGQEAEPVVTVEKGDRRFKDAAWQEN